MKFWKAVSRYKQVMLEAEMLRIQVSKDRFLMQAIRNRAQENTNEIETTEVSRNIDLCKEMQTTSSQLQNLLSRFGRLEAYIMQIANKPIEPKEPVEEEIALASQKLEKTFV
ncbi:uncharacterized protein [Periplaneta americana]|uniref:uncharacterized protein isoform X2 n=1 Tax=Periplaneta americana TaxID=6978 RepID=UPI0037E8B209